MVVNSDGESTMRPTSLRGDLVVRENFPKEFKACWNLLPGTVARITNWQEMSDGERETTRRILAKRNAKRIAALKKEGKEIQLPKI
jgi:hypothetical protein